MMKKIVIAIAALILFNIPSFGQSVKVDSPDGKVKFVLNVRKEGIDYRVSLGKERVIAPSKLGFVFDSGSLGENMRIIGTERRLVDETYRLVTGKTAEARDYCNEAVVHLAQKSGGKRFDIVVRVYDDGAAFRFVFPEQKGWNCYVMYDELTEITPAGNPKMLYMNLPGYISTHENVYNFDRYTDVHDGRLIEMPVTMQFDNGVYTSVTEAAIRNYAGMYLMKDNGVLRGKLSPRLGQERIKVVIDSFPHSTPWRVISVSKRLGDLIETDILTSLNEPCPTNDTDWIRPCSTTFTWWNGNIVPDSNFSPGNNFETNKYYIDFAARNGIDLHDIYGYAETAWYTDDNYNFGVAGPNADVTRPVASLDMNRIAAYAHSKGVGIHLWVHWKSLYDRLDEAFALYESWCVKGLMVDFMDRDDQEMIIIQEEILRSAMRHHLFIQFHGASKPSGLIRTYPNEFTREGTLNYEVCKWASSVNADHDISVPFTRMLAGPADYHLGGFRALPRDKHIIHYTNPYVMSTRCHMLAMYVVLENYLTSLCDTPMAYEGQKGFDFLCQVPADWAETKVIDASLNEYIVVARRSEDDWWIGAITNREGRRLNFGLDFLESGCRYEATIYTDAADADVNPDNIDITLKEVTADDAVELALVTDGGVAIKLRKL